jgi:alkanesulfonate monooxygenase SsuD/methylene tetrahydromethanopterin reductase-like flavin-dependent oxidoreductase (luciferase family)
LCQCYISHRHTTSGRLFAAGIGPGSHKGDYDVSGIPFDQRWSRFKEALEILNKLWDYTQAEQHSELDKVDYNGKHYQLEKVSFTPKPYQTTSSYIHRNLGIIKSRSKKSSKIWRWLDGLCL